MFICVKLGERQYEAIFPHVGLSYLLLVVETPTLRIMNLRASDGVSTARVYHDQPAIDIWQQLLTAGDERTSPASIKLMYQAGQEAAAAMAAVEA